VWATTFFKTDSQKVHLPHKENKSWVFNFFGKLRSHFSKFFSFFYSGSYCISTSFVIKSMLFESLQVIPVVFQALPIRKYEKKKFLMKNTQNFNVQIFTSTIYVEVFVKI